MKLSNLLRADSDRTEYLILFSLFLLLGIVLLSTSIEGPFSIDEINYLVTATGLRHGVMTVPGTEGLTPSKELFAFDPDASKRIPASTPVFSAAPPLYGPLAVLFLPLGWRGLVLLNTLSFLITGLIVFLLVRSFSTRRQTSWIALALVLGGASFLEYAQGVWPHMISVALVTGSLALLVVVWHSGKAAYAFMAGLLIGAAVGIREQNIVLAGSLGLTLLLFGNARIRSTVWYTVGAAIPLGGIATMHFFRQGLWHPFPKVNAYASNVGQQIAGQSHFDPLGTLWTRIVDFSSQGDFTEPMLSVLYRRDPNSGALLVDGVVKKALLQSSPWIALALAAFIAIWVISTWRETDNAGVIRPWSLVVAALLAAFSLLGIGRTDGLAYNQRYFLELVPIAAVVVSLVLDRMGSRLFPFIMGLLGSGLLFALILLVPSQSVFRLAILKVPLILSVLTVLVAFVMRGRAKESSVAAVLGLCLGWSVMVQLVADLPASRSRRERNGAVLSMLERHVPARSAVFAYGGWRDAAGALAISRDIIVIDTGADEGKDSGVLAQELKAMERPVFILGNGVPTDIIRRIAGGDSLRLTAAEPLPLFSIIPKKSR